MIPRRILSEKTGRDTFSEDDPIEVLSFEWVPGSFDAYAVEHQTAIVFEVVPAPPASLILALFISMECPRRHREH